MEEEGKQSNKVTMLGIALLALLLLAMYLVSTKTELPLINTILQDSTEKQAEIKVVEQRDWFTMEEEMEMQEAYKAIMENKEKEKVFLPEGNLEPEDVVLYKEDN